MSTVFDDGHTLPRTRAGSSWAGRMPSWLGVLWRRWSEAQPFQAPPRKEWPVALRRARIVGFALIGVQLIGLGWWSYVLASRYALTKDFAEYEQAAFLLAHGHLNPYSTIVSNTFWQDHGDFMFLPIALVQALWLHPVVLSWAQDLAIVGAEAIAFAWICEIAARRAQHDRRLVLPVLLIALGVVLLVANPWIAWGLSFDYHVEAVSTLFLLATLYDLHHDRRRVWVWVVCCLLSGDIGGTYIVASGISGVLVSRSLWRRGVAIAALGLATLIAFSLLHFNHGTNSHAYGPLVFANGSAENSGQAFSAITILTSVLEHPARAMHILWQNRGDAWANTSPVGIVGLFWLPVMPVLILILAEGQLASQLFAAPGFQNLPIASLAAVGTVAICSAVAGRHLGRKRWLAPSLIALLMANAIAWAVVWLPQVKINWLRVTPAAAMTLKSIESKIGSQDEVLVSQGIVGGFAYRPAIYPLFSPTITVPVRATKVWIILAPSQGVETASVSGVYEDIDELSTDPSMRLVVAKDGIWAFAWKVPPGVRTLELKPSSHAYTPAWTVPGKAGIAIDIGPERDWHVASTAQVGDVIDHDYWRELPGAYTARVTLAVSSTANVEVWNTTTSTTAEPPIGAGYKRYDNHTDDI